MSHNSQLKFSDVSTAWFSVQTGDNKVWQRDGVDQVSAQDGGQEPQQPAQQPQDDGAGQGGGDRAAEQHLPQHLTCCWPVVTDDDSQVPLWKTFENMLTWCV